MSDTPTISTSGNASEFINFEALSTLIASGELGPEKNLELLKQLNELTSAALEYADSIINANNTK